jgi:hypothetical protein
MKVEKISIPSDSSILVGYETDGVHMEYEPGTVGGDIGALLDGKHYIPFGMTVHALTNTFSLDLIKRETVLREEYMHTRQEIQDPIFGRPENTVGYDITFPDGRTLVVELSDKVAEYERQARPKAHPADSAQPAYERPQPTLDAHLS